MYNHVPAPGVFPRLFFSARDIPAIRAKLEHTDCRLLWARLLQGCERRLDAEPSRLHTWHVRPSHLAFAHLMTGRDDFADKAIELARKIAEKDRVVEPRKGATRPGVCLATGHLVSELMLTYDWLHNRVPADLKARIRWQIDENGFRANRYDYDTHFPASRWHNNNGINVINGPLLSAAILLEHDMDTRDGYELAHSQTRTSIGSYCPDGGYHEGPGYWNYCVRHLLLGVEALRRHKGIDYYQEPFLRNTGDYLVQFVLPWNVNSANPADSGDLTHPWPGIARLASYHRRADWQRLARWFIKHDWPATDGEAIEYALFYLLWYDPELPDAEPSPEHRTRLFHGLQQLSMRSDWSPRATHVLWLNGPSNCSHNHLHLNTFSVAAFGRQLIVDMGTHDYANYFDYRRLTRGHNTLLVDNAEQLITTDDSLWCKRLRAGEWGTVFGEFRCLREEGDITIATGSVVNAYHGKLRTFDRTMAFVERRFLFLHDFIELEKTPPAELTWLFHSDESIEWRGSDAMFRSGHARLRFVPMCDLTLRNSIGTDQRRISSPHACDPYLRFDATCDRPAIDFFALLVPYEGDAEPSASLTRQGADVRFEVAGKAWIYEYRTRTVRGEHDTPLPRIPV